MRRVIVVGSANTDLTVKVDALPRPGETVVGHELMVSYGGKGANQALAALRAGAEVGLLAKIGTDPYGELLYNHLVRSGFEREGLIRDQDTAGGLALIAVDRGGNNQIVVVPGSNGRFVKEDLRSLESFARDGSLLLTQLEIPLPTVEYALRLARRLGMKTILDPAPACPIPPGLYPLIDILTPNETEAGGLTGMLVETPSQAEKAAKVLVSRGCPMVIVTLGAQGVLVGRAEGIEFYPALRVDAVDTVGAGDAFNGALAAALAAGRSFSRAIAFANAAGALSTTRRGAQESLPTEEEIERFLQGRGREEQGGGRV
ncbi:MAG: ribokinase [Deltaproteobacteria bacterium]|nr:ribokinase [Deltaproteobacteria bacterium]